MKSLITHEIISTLKEDLHNNVGTLRQLDIELPFSISVGMIRITVTKNDMYLTLSEEVSSKYVNDWNADIGKLMSKTLKKRRFELIYIYETNIYKAIIRKCPDDEVEQITQSGFDHLHIGDDIYTIIRVVPRNGVFVFYDRASFDPDEYFTEEDNNEEDEETETYAPDNSGTFESLSLFEE